MKFLVGLSLFKRLAVDFRRQMVLQRTLGTKKAKNDFHHGIEIKCVFMTVFRHILPDEPSSVEIFDDWLQTARRRTEVFAKMLEKQSNFLQ